MRKIIYLLEKEFKQILRDKMMIAIILGVPILQLLILPWAVDLDVRHVSLSIVDLDKSTYSRELTSKFTAAESFVLYSSTESYKSAMKDLEADKADIILTIPANFERDLMRENHNQLGVTTNAINGVKAVLGTYYLNMIINDFHRDIVLKNHPQLEKSMPNLLDVRSTFWFNPEGNYRHFMVPAILVLLLTVVGAFLTALNIVKEKEIGTIEQINVTPIKKWEFIVGKLVPFWIIGNIVFSIGLLLMRFLYEIPILGSVPLLFLFANIYIISILGMGLLISTFAHTQQQAMFVGYFFVMIFIMMSGLFTSVDSMPAWAKSISHLLPITYLMEASRAIIIKGAQLAEISDLLLYIGAFAVGLTFLAVLKYKKRS